MYGLLEFLLSACQPCVSFFGISQGKGEIVEEVAERKKRNRGWM